MEEGRGQLPFGRERSVTQRIDPGIDTKQATARDQSRNRSVPEPQRPHLPPRHHPKLALGKTDQRN